MALLTMALLTMALLTMALVLTMAPLLLAMAHYSLQCTGARRMLGVRPQLMHNANLAFAASELLFNNLPVLPLHFIFGALFGVQYTSHGRTQGGAAFGPAGSPEASLSARACLRLPQAPWPASANQPLGPRCYPSHTGLVST